VINDCNSNEDARTLAVTLSFFDADKKYDAGIYSVAKDANRDKNPTAYEIEKKTVTNSDSLTLKLTPDGGTTISFMPVKE